MYWLYCVESCWKLLHYLCSCSVLLFGSLFRLTVFHYFIMRLNPSAECIWHVIKITWNNSVCYLSCSATAANLSNTVFLGELYSRHCDSQACSGWSHCQVKANHLFLTTLMVNSVYKFRIDLCSFSHPTLLIYNTLSLSLVIHGSPQAVKIIYSSWFRWFFQLPINIYWEEIFTEYNHLLACKYMHQIRLKKGSCWLLFQRKCMYATVKHYSFPE